VGSWKLKAAKTVRANGEIVFPYGKNPIGLLIYDALGNMSGHVSRRGRDAYKMDDLRKGTVQEMSAAIKSYLAYFGTYTVNKKGGYVTHRVTGSLFPNWIGSRQKRFYKLTRDTLELSAPFTLDGQIHTALLIWKRIT
jgi:hypothetical protein